MAQEISTSPDTESSGCLLNISISFRCLSVLLDRERLAVQPGPGTILAPPLYELIQNVNQEEESFLIPLRILLLVVIVARLSSSPVGMGVTEPTWFESVVIDSFLGKLPCSSSFKLESVSYFVMHFLHYGSSLRNH